MHSGQTDEATGADVGAGPRAAPGDDAERTLVARLAGSEEVTVVGVIAPAAASGAPGSPAAAPAEASSGAPDDGERTVAAASMRRGYDAEGVTFIDLAIGADLAIAPGSGSASGRAASPPKPVSQDVETQRGLPGDRVGGAPGADDERTVRDGAPDSAPASTRDGRTVSDRPHAAAGLHDAPGPRDATGFRDASREAARDGRTVSDRLARIPPARDGRTASDRLPFGHDRHAPRDGATAVDRGLLGEPAGGRASAPSTDPDNPSQASTADFLRGAEASSPSSASDPGGGADGASSAGTSDGSVDHSLPTVHGPALGAGTSPDDLQAADTERGRRRRLEHADALVGAVADGKYRVLSLLGRGGFGAVYKALHIDMNRPVAFKTLLPDLVTEASVLARFRREAQVASRFTHPHAIQVYDFSRLPDGTWYIAMELLQGESLHARLKRERRLPVDGALNIAAQCLSALAAAHERGVVHRDLKPDNIFLEEKGDLDVVAKVIDFGIAKIADKEPGSAGQGEGVAEGEGEGEDGALAGTGTESDLAAAAAEAAFVTQVGSFTGTPAYASPEQCEGEPIDPRSDVYSFGIVLYRMLAGELPFSSDTPAGYLAQHLFEPVRSLRVSQPDLGVPEALDALVLRALAKAPGDRFADAGAMLEAVMEVAAGLGIELAGALGASGMAAQRVVTVARPRWLAPLLAAVLLLVAAVTGFAVWKSRQRAAEAWPPPHLAALFEGVEEELRRGAFDSASEAITAGYAEHAPALAPDRRDRLSAWRDEAARRVEAARTADRDEAARALRQALALFAADPSERGAAALEAALAELARRHPRAPAAADAEVGAALADAAARAERGGAERLEALAAEAAELRTTRSFAAATEALERSRGAIAAAFPRRLAAAERIAAQALAAWEADAQAEHQRRRAAAEPLRDRCLYADALAALGGLGTPFAGTEADRAHAELRRAWEAEAAAPGPRALAEALEAERRGAGWRELLPAYQDLARRFADEPRLLATAVERARAQAAARARDAEAALAALQAALDQAIEEARFEEALRLVEAFDAEPYGEDVPAGALAALREGVHAATAGRLVALADAFDDPAGAYRRGGLVEQALADLAPYRRLEAPSLADVRQAAEARAIELEAILPLHQDMVAIPRQRAVIGRDDAPAWSERPAHAVDLLPFRIDRAEVSTAVYALFVVVTDHRAPPHWPGGKPPPGQDDLPVTQVSRDDAEAFARWAWKRLPTEAEWEAAARAKAGDGDGGVGGGGGEGGGAGEGGGSLYPWGAAWSIDREPWRALIEGSWKRDRRFAGEKPRPLPVTSTDFRNEHPLGLVHLIGNVEEWTSSTFLPYAGAAPPAGVKGLGAHGVVRGGGFQSLLPAQATSTVRRDVAPGERRADVGFRCVSGVGGGE